MCRSRCDTPSDTHIDRRELRADIEFDADGVGCPLADDDGTVLNHQLLEDTCYILCEDEHGDVPAEVRQREKRVDPSCPCLAFRQNDCVPLFTAGDDGHVVVTTYLSDRETLQRLIRDLREIVDYVSLRRLTASAGDGFTDVRSADLSLLTERERDVLTRAIESGYYDDPRGIEFETLASRLDVSKSTLSQRLSAAESKLLVDLLES